MSGRVRAIIIDEGSIILVKRIKASSTYWVFPGGGVEQGETNKQALLREIREELGVSARIGGRFLKLHLQKPGVFNHLESFYLAKITGGILGSGDGPEFQGRNKYEGEYLIERVKLNDLKSVNLKPDKVKEAVIKEFL